MYNMLQGCHLVRNIAIGDGAGNLHFLGGDKGVLESLVLFSVHGQFGGGVL